jgi:hypothetical protein
MIYETYMCAKSNGNTEYGFAFKADDSEDTLFDLVLGETTSTNEKFFSAEWEMHEWAAKAVVAAAAKES